MYITINEGDVYKAAFRAVQTVSDKEPAEAAVDMISGVCKATDELLKLFTEETENEKEAETT